MMASPPRVQPMKTPRRDFIANAGAAAAAMHDLAHAQEPDHEHEHSLVPSDPALRVKSLESLLVEKGLVDPAALDALIDTYEHKIGPRNGAQVVARAWVDPAFKKRLLANGTATIGELGFGGRGGDYLVVVENTPKVHNLIVCTLCSCYPWAVLGLPPVWYKSAAYRSRAVIDPRGVLREFGLDLPQDVEIRVHDSTAELRYLVLPERPAGRETLSEDELAALVTCDAMIGVADVPLPAGERAATASTTWPACPGRCALHGGPARARSEHHSDRAHAPAALRARQARNGRARPRPLCFSRYERAFPGREAPAPLFRAFRRPRTLGRASRAARCRLRQSLG